MGLRGIGAKPLKTGELAEQPWEKPRMSRPNRVIKFIESLSITSGKDAGKKFRLRPWQKDIIRAIYRTKNKKRIVRQALVTMPRKQGKTVLSAGLALAHLAGPEAESRGQVFSAGADREQAGLLYNEMVAFIEASEYLSDRLIIRHFKKEIEDSKTRSVYKPLTADGRKAHGLNPSFVVMDELAQWRGRTLYDNLSTGSGARTEPLQIVISTASSDPQHIMTELVNYGRKVNQGVIKDPAFHATIYEAPLDADPWDEQTWRDCNPALGDFRSLEEMQKFAEQAKRMPAKEAAFRNLYLNQPVDPEQRFISGADWDGCAEQVDLETLRGCECWGGLDLSSTTDLTALVLFFPESGAVLCWFWLPADDLTEREERDRVPYLTWRKQGFIDTAGGRAIDKRAVAYKLAEVLALYDVKAIAFDRWRIEDFKHILADEGIEANLVPFGQGYKDMGGAVDELERAVLEKKIKHGGHPVLRWNCSNAVVVLDPAGARKIAKDKSIGRVDGLVALAMALGLHAREPGEVEYDFSGQMVLTA